MQAGHLSIAVPGFIGIRGKVAKTTRLHLEATALLAICYLRQKKLAGAEPLIREVLRNRNIRSESRRKQFLREVVSRFKEEGLLGALSGQVREELDAEEVQQLAADLVRTKNEDEILSEMWQGPTARICGISLEGRCRGKAGAHQQRDQLPAGRSSNIGEG